jgi:hypothetical protein
MMVPAGAVAESDMESQTPASGSTTTWLRNEVLCIVASTGLWISLITASILLVFETITSSVFGIILVLPVAFYLLEAIVSPSLGPSGVLYILRKGCDEVTAHKVLQAMKELTRPRIAFWMKAFELSADLDVVER